MTTIATIDYRDYIYYRSMADREILISILFNDWMTGNEEAVGLLEDITGKGTFETADFEKTADFILNNTI